MNVMMNPIRIKPLNVGILCLVAWLLPTLSQAQDGVYKYKVDGGTTKVSGKITNVTPDGVVIGNKAVAAEEIKRLYYSREPAGLNRAREQMQDGRFSDALEDLDELDATTMAGPLKQEYDFIKANSKSQLSIRGIRFTPQEAGKELRDFIIAHPSSLHVYPAIEQYGKQLFAFGKPDLAAKEFAKLAQCSWNEYRLKGLFQRGKALIEDGKPNEAQSAFDTISAVQSNDDLSQTYRLLAQSETARLKGINGNAPQAVAILEKMILDESAENGLLFANIYNALGAIHEKSGKIKEARTAYLHTNLLYASEGEAHAEALYRLSLIWPQLEETDRANDARETLKTRYRNSYWAGKR
ncbi:MAG: Flp pilus assembly protein TadD [Mariniblastus sp.]|jgi:Flp pilus assembly protein TadD